MFSRWCKVTPDNSVHFAGLELLLLVLAFNFVAFLEPLLLHLVLDVLVDMPYVDLLVYMVPYKASCVLECFVEIGNENQGLHDVLVDTELLDTLENPGIGHLVFFVHKPKKDIECHMKIGDPTDVDKGQFEAVGLVYIVEEKYLLLC